MVSFSINSLLSGMTLDAMTDGTGPLILVRRSDNGVVTVTSRNSVSVASGAGTITMDADGATILQRNCQQCHELAVASKKPEKEDWDVVITRMMTYGARLTPAERPKLTFELLLLAPSAHDLGADLEVPVREAKPGRFERVAVLGEHEGHMARQ